MKKIILTLLIAFTALQGFGQKSELESFIGNSYKRASLTQPFDSTLFLTILDSAVQANPTSEITEQYASFCFRYSTPQTFIKTAEIVLNKPEHKDKWYIYVILAHNYKFNAEYKKCISTLNDAKQYAEDDKYINTSVLAQSYRMLGEYNEAEKVFKKMLEIDSTDYFSYCHYAYLLNFMNRPDEAIALLDYVHSDSFDRSGYGDYGRVNFIYGYSYYLKADYKEAIKYLKQQVNEVKDEWVSMYFIAKSYEKLGDTENACAYYTLSTKYYKETEKKSDITDRFNKTYFGKLLISYYEDALKHTENLNCP